MSLQQGDRNIANQAAALQASIQKQCLSLLLAFNWSKCIILGIEKVRGQEDTILPYAQREDQKCSVNSISDYHNLLHSS